MTRGAAYQGAGPQQRLTWTLVIGTLALGLLLAASTGEADLEKTTFRLHVAIAREGGDAVVDDDWITAQVAMANRIFKPAEVAFRIARKRALSETYARLNTRRDRHALGRFLEPGYINWWVVASLRDVDDPSQFRRGVHWRPRGDYPPGAHFVIVSAIAAPTVLAHELGHFFGNRRHSDTPGNIMSYTRLDGLPWFDPAQLRTIERFRQRFVRSGELLEDELNSSNVRRTVP